MSEDGENQNQETYMFGLYAKREAYEEKISLDQGCTSSCS